ncbi:MAG TPA: hypothetical protein DCM49_02390 [Lachnospiraceae bacterium]|nr:hypothetical protein [Lachnospiraceae bacterium]
MERASVPGFILDAGSVLKHNIWRRGAGSVYLSRNPEQLIIGCAGGKRKLPDSDQQKGKI